MSSILYYSTYCDNCSKLLQAVARSNSKKEMHFINIDKRIKKSNGATYIILENGQEILLPPTINKVPALLLLNKGHQVLFGNDINKADLLIYDNIEVITTADFNNSDPIEFISNNVLQTTLDTIESAYINGTLLSELEFIFSKFE